MSASSQPVPRRRVTALALGRATAGQAWVGTHDGVVARIGSGGIAEAIHVGTGRVCALGISADDRWLLVASDDGSIVVLDTRDGSRRAFTGTGVAVVQAVVLGPAQWWTVDGLRQGWRWQVGADGTVTTFPMHGDGHAPLGLDEIATADGSILTVRSALGWARWRTDLDAVQSWHEPLPGMQLAYVDGVIGLSPDGRHVFAYWDDFDVFDAETGAVLRSHPTEHRAGCGAASSEVERVVLGGARGELWLVDGSGRTQWGMQPGSGAIRCACIDAAGATAGWIDRAGRAGLVDVGAGTELLEAARLRDGLDAVELP